MLRRSSAGGHIAIAHRRFLGFAFLFGIFVNLLMLTGPLFMLQVYDRVLASRSEETLVALVILVVGLYALMWLLDFSRARLLARYGARVQLGLESKVFQTQLLRSLQEGTRLSGSRNLETIQAFFGSPALLAIMDLPFTPVFLILIFSFHPWLGGFAVMGGLVLVLITVLAQILTAQRVARAQSATEAAHRFAGNASSSVEIVKSQGMLGPVTERFLARRNDALAQSMVAVDWTGAFSTFSKAFRLTLQSLVLALGAWLVLQGDITAGAMIAASILLGRALAPIEQIIGRWPQIVQARQAWRSLTALLADASTEPTRTRLERPEGRLELKGVTLPSAPGKPPILYNVGFTISPGEALGVIGRSGSGKTTIAKTILGLVDPSIGEVRLGGALISHYAASDLGAYVGYLPQDSSLISGTIAENIARMSLAPDSSAVIAAARKAMAHDLILSLPDGYDTRIEDNQIGLSGGQRQRIALARALYGDPVLLVLDEPNSALDQEGSEALNAAIRTMKTEGRSVVIMTHRPVAISECDTLIVLENGAIKATGPRDEIIRSMMRNADAIRQTVSGVAAS